MSIDETQVCEHQLGLGLTLKHFVEEIPRIQVNPEQGAAIIFNHDLRHGM